LTQKVQLLTIIPNPALVLNFLNKNGVSVCPLYFRKLKTTKVKDE